ncbi:Uncharacterized protein HZ326_16063 [Fusarium oxysporum f. sp. albedinis]|nr:Uncharacterized protein HZ326_16063 [Fusarium oxysporum f. sp. albedinis]
MKFCLRHSLAQASRHPQIRREQVLTIDLGVDMPNKFLSNYQTASSTFEQGTGHDHADMIRNPIVSRGDCFNLDN